MSLFPTRLRGWLAGARTFTPARGAGNKHGTAGRFPVRYVCRGRLAGNCLPGIFSQAD
jgi:hypothetical protein